MNKNLVIGILAAMLVLASLWGQVGNKSKKALQRQLKTIATGQSVKTSGDAHKTGHTTTAAHAIKTVTSETKVETTQATADAEVADSKKMLEVTEAQLTGVRHKLAKLTKSSADFQAQIIKKDAALAALTEEKNKLVAELKHVQHEVISSENSDSAMQQKLTDMSKALQAKEQQFKAAHDEFNAAAQHTAEIIKGLEEKAAASEAKALELQEKLDASLVENEELEAKVEALEAANAQLLDESKVASDYEVAKAQVIGLEKIIEDKNVAIDETSKELDNLKINTDVLLSRISEQQDVIQEISNEYREMVKELAVKNKDLADLKDQLLQTPVQQ